MDWLDQLSKVELHIHLEGAIPLPTLWELVRKYGGDEAVPDQAALHRRFQFRDFPHFIDTWVWKNGFLRELDDFALIAEAVARDLKEQNIRYVEAFYSPPDFRDAGLSPQQITVAIREGLDRVAGIDVRLVCDFVRDLGPHLAADTLEAICEVRDQGVVGVGIGGSEHAYPPEPFAAVYEAAREHGFFTSAHAGEAAGPESIWGAIRTLRVDRIGHGTRAFEDDALVDYLVEHKVPLEMCPMSNVRTGVVESLAAHPIRTYKQRGVRISVNTDDPAMFQTSLADEYRQLQTVHGFDDDDIRGLVDSAVDMAWLSDTEKTALRASLTADC